MFFQSLVIKSPAMLCNIVVKWPYIDTYFVVLLQTNNKCTFTSLHRFVMSFSVIEVGNQ